MRVSLNRDDFVRNASIRDVWPAVCAFFFVAFAIVAAPTAVSAKNPCEIWNLAELKTAPEADWGELVRRTVANVDGTPCDVETCKVFYRSVPFRDKPTRTMAFFSKPIGDGPFPAMVLVHGGGGSAFSSWTEMWAARGYVAISMDLYGDEVLSETSTESPNIDRRRMDDGGPNLSVETIFSGFPDDGKSFKDFWPYHCVANIMLAHSLIASLPCVDASRTGVTGISWGGYLTALIAGIDDRFRVAVPVYGCGALTSLGFVAAQFQANLTVDEIKRWNELFEPNEFLPRAKCRVLFVDGTCDFAFPLEMNRTSWAKTPNADARIEIGMNHSHYHGWSPREIGNYVDWVLKEGAPLPCLGPLLIERRDAGEVLISAELKYGAKPTSARLNYALGPDVYPSEERKNRAWRSIPAEIRDGKVVARLPENLDAETVDCFLDATDSAGNAASTHYETVENVPVSSRKATN